MAHRYRHWLTALALTLGLTAVDALGDEDYEVKLKELQSAIKTLQSELNKVKTTRDQLQNDLQTSEVDISELVKKIERLKEELASQKKQLTQLNQRQDELQAARQQQQQHIAQHIQTAHRLGQQSQLKLLLNQEQPDQVARMQRYYRYFLDARAEKIHTYLDTIAELDTLKPRIETRTRELAQSQNQLQQRHQQLQARQSERQQTLARLNDSIQRKDEELQQKAQDQERLEKLLTEVTAAIANMTMPGDSQPFAQLRGKLAMPVKGPIVRPFGSSRVAGKLNWEGILIGADEGAAVQAIHYGRVVFADYLRGQGLLLILDHGDGYMSLYAHNQALLKEPGDWVNSGEVIARVGNSGGQARAGLYFEIRHRGRPTDPVQWCRRG